MEEESEMANQPAITAANRKYVSPSFTGQSDPYYSSINAAIGKIKDASATNMYAVYVYPGEYAEAVAMKSYVSLIGSGIDSTVIKSDGTHDVITGPSDGGSGQCYINNLSIDALQHSAIVFKDSTNAKDHFIIDVKVYTTTDSSSPAITIGDNELVNCIGFNCLGFPTLQPPPNPPSYLFDYGIQLNLNTNANLRMRQSNIYSESYCVDHQSSATSETHNSIMSSNSSSFHITNGNANIYECVSVGQVLAESGAQLKYVNFFHDGHFTVETGSTIWVTNMQWGETAGIDVLFELFDDGSKIIVSNCKAGVTGTHSWVVNVHSAGSIFKAFNSEFNNSGSGATITGVSGATVYLYYCVMNKDISNVSKSSDSNYIISSDIG